ARVARKHRVEIAGDDAETLPERGNGKPRFAEPPKWGHTIPASERVVFQREQANQRRFARAVGTKDGGVLAGVDGKRHAIEYSRAASDDRGIGQFENWRGARHAGDR